jgi:hypothetical protein
MEWEMALLSSTFLQITVMLTSSSAAYTIPRGDKVSKPVETE